MAGGEGFEPSTPNLGGWSLSVTLTKSPSTPAIVDWQENFRDPNIERSLKGGLLAKVNYAFSNEYREKDEEKG